MRSKEYLKVLFYNGSSYLDYSKKALDFLNDSFVLKLEPGKPLYIGFHKPINTFYVEFKVENSVANDISGKYWDSTSLTFKDLDNFFDDTNGFVRSGFISWDRNQENQNDKNKINDIELFWYKFEASVAHSNTTEIMGINILFACDKDLKKEVYDIATSKFLPEGAKTHVATHVASRDEIVQTLRNEGRTKITYTDPKNKVYADAVNGTHEEMITAWDLLDIGEIKQAALYLTLSKIYRNLVDKPDDYYTTQSAYFYNKFKEAFNVFKLTLDENDDGIVSNQENLENRVVYMVR